MVDAVELIPMIETVMPGLDPGIHVLSMTTESRLIGDDRKSWMAGSSPAMTKLPAEP
jgi:hypothetical protein